MIKHLLLVFSLLIFLLSSFNSYAYDIFATEVIGRVSYDNASMPTDVIINADKTYQVYDSFLGKLVLYKNSKLSKEIKSPEIYGGVAVYYNDNKYYFSVPIENSVKVVDNKLKLIRKISSSDKKKFDPTDAVIVNDKLYIVDNDNNRVLRFNAKTFAQENSIGTVGSEIQNLRYPFSVAVDKEGFLFVTDVINARISVIAPTNKIVQVFGKFGVDVGELYRPTGIAIYKEKYVLISDGYLGVIQVFDLLGRPLGVIGDEKKVIKKYASPSRIRVTGDVVGVIDSYDRVVEIFTISDLL